MQNQQAAVAKRLCDPDFQARVVNRCMLLTICLFGLFAAGIAHDVFKTAFPAQRPFYRIDGRLPPQPMTPLPLPAR